MDENIENNNICTKGTATPKLPSKRKLPQVSDENQSALDVFREKLLLKSYSRHTQRTYYYEFAQLPYILKNHPRKACADTENVLRHGIARRRSCQPENGTDINFILYKNNTQKIYRQNENIIIY